VFRIREVLEGLAARLATEDVRRGTDAGELLELEARPKKEFEGSALAYMRYNDAFHNLVVRLSGNRQLIELVRQLHVRVYRLQVEALRSSASYIDSRREHGGIVRAIVKGDGGRAESDHRKYWPTLLSFLREQPSATLLSTPSASNAALRKRHRP
jgi:DNA-binding GntR family transcriptional regulator